MMRNSKEFCGMNSKILKNCNGFQGMLRNSKEICEILGNERNCNKKFQGNLRDSKVILGFPWMHMDTQGRFWYHQSRLVRSGLALVPPGAIQVAVACILISWRSQ